MNSSEGPSLHGASRGENFGLPSEATLQISEEGQVVGVSVVCCEPRLAGNCSY